MLPSVCDVLGSILPLPHLCRDHWVEIRRGQTNGLGKLSFQQSGDKADQLFYLTPSTNVEIKERIGASTSLYTTEPNKDTFRPGTVFKSFHYQAKTPISKRALLAGFLMLWLKRCIVPTHLHEVIVADVVYPAIFLAFG